MLKPFSQTVAAQPAFRGSWQFNTAPDLVVNHPLYGALHHGVVHNDDQPVYDTLIWSEPVGAICVPVDPEERIVMIRQRRPVMRPVMLAGEFPMTDYAACGSSSLELPRGFANPGEAPIDAARRETEEEIGGLVLSVKRLGYNNSNTTFYCNCNQVFLLRVSEVGTRLRPDVGEEIEGIECLTYMEVLERVMANEIVCGMTKSALLHYAAHQSTAGR